MLNYTHHVTFFIRHHFRPENKDVLAQVVQARRDNEWKKNDVWVPQRPQLISDNTVSMILENNNAKKMRNDPRIGDETTCYCLDSLSRCGGCEGDVAG